MAFAIGLANKTIFGLCGYVSLALIPAGSGDTVLLPEVHPELGDPCYWANAWIKDPRRRETVSDGGFCISSTHGWIINVNYGKIRLRTK